MIFRFYVGTLPAMSGYIAGSGDGIVTVGSVPSSRKISLLNTKTLAFIQQIDSLKNGHYMFMNLDPTQQYIVMVRDYKKEFEPFAWDYVSPANDLTVDEQRALWQSWQT